MAVLYETEEYDSLQQAVMKAERLGYPVLFSLVKQVEPIDPLAFYQAGKNRFAGERFFWQDQTGELVMAGLGAAAKMQTDKSFSRVTHIKKRWDRLRRAAVQAGAWRTEGTGPLLFGGFSFDPDKPSSLIWPSFDSGLFYLPAFLLTVRSGQFYLTMNQPCRPGDRPDLLLSALNRMEKGLFNSRCVLPVKNNRLIQTRRQDPGLWKQLVQEAVRQMEPSGMKKVVLARTLRLLFEKKLEPETVLQRLRDRQTGNFIFSLESVDDCFLGASPERLIRKSGGHVFSTCLAGSAARGNSRETDEQLGLELLHNKKNRLEHRYVVTAIKQVLGELCGVLNVPDHPVLLKNKDIQHLYTPIRGELSRHLSILDIVEKLHPTPALGGVPTDKAVRWIGEHENLDRGFYASPIGWCDTYGNGEFAVGIRSALMHGREATLFAGCGIVGDSVPETEYEETAIKFHPMLDALGETAHGSR
ncbi:isochorismate synthase [Sporolactobacillus sp. THM7-7]|nr:isochorismate synthase [Sporolactobacillus sp. THM7-7]